MAAGRAGSRSRSRTTSNGLDSSFARAWCLHYEGTNVFDTTAVSSLNVASSSSHPEIRQTWNWQDSACIAFKVCTWFSAFYIYMTSICLSVEYPCNLMAGRKFYITAISKALVPSWQRERKATAIISLAESSILWIMSFLNYLLIFESSQYITAMHTNTT